MSHSRLCSFAAFAGLLVSPGCDFEPAPRGWVESEPQQLQIDPDPDDPTQNPVPILQSRSIAGATGVAPRASLAGLRRNGSPVQEVELANGHLSGSWTDGAGLPERLSGSALVGVSVNIEGDSGPDEYSIDSVKALADFPPARRGVPWHVSTVPDQVVLYYLTGAQGDYCRPPTVGPFPPHVPDRPANSDWEIFKYALAIPLVWDSTGTASESATHFTFACLSGAAAKCQAWGYGGQGGVETSLALMQTCTRMATADYCGDGNSQTIPGTRIDFADNAGVNPTDHWSESGLRAEALWGPKGAYCMSHARLENTLGLAVDAYDSTAWQPIGRLTRDELLDAVCEARRTAYGHQMDECSDASLRSATLPLGAYGRTGADDPVIANSSEHFVWFVEREPVLGPRPLPTPAPGPRPFPPGGPWTPGPSDPYPGGGGGVPSLP